MLDIHSHILPGLDDGVRDLESAVALAAEASAAGVKVMAATPHVRSDFPTTSAQIAEGVRTVAAALALHEIPLDVVGGAEIAMDWIPRVVDDDLPSYTLAGTGRYLLVEFPYEGWPRAAELLLSELASRGVTAVLAHPERNDAVQEDASRLRVLTQSTGALVQVTAGSLGGRFGSRTRSTALSLVDVGLAHVVASDVHGPGVSERVWLLPPDIPPVLAEWLTVTAPRAILSGQDVPARPAAAGRLRRTGRGLFRGWSNRLAGRAQHSRRESR